MKKIESKWKAISIYELMAFIFFSALTFFFCLRGDYWFPIPAYALINASILGIIITIIWLYHQWNLNSKAQVPDLREKTRVQFNPQTR